MKPVRSAACLLLVLTASCGTDADKPASTPQARKSMNERFGGGGRDPNSFQQDANGKLMINDSKRSYYESKGESYYGGKEFKKQEYKAGDYAKKSWWGNKEYDRQAYDGNTDGSRFQTPSDLQGKGAREAGSAADIPDKYQTGTYATGSANEAGNAPIKKGTNDAIENRRKVFEQPEIIDYREQRALTVDQSKSLLGN